jgi:hypothetical protein
MKQGKKPTRAQKKLIGSTGRDPAMYRVEKEFPDHIIFRHIEWLKPETIYTKGK